MRNRTTSPVKAEMIAQRSVETLAAMNAAATVGELLEIGRAWDRFADEAEVCPQIRHHIADSRKRIAVRLKAKAALGDRPEAA